jgi:hypothetical protein
MPWAGRPASSTSRTQHSQDSVSFTTLNSSTLIPRSSPTGPTVSTLYWARGRRARKICRPLRYTLAWSSLPTWSHRPSRAWSLSR